MASRFGAYEILYELKTGGMGAVLLGRRKGPGAFEQLVAIKTIRPEYAQTQAVRAMFLDEAAILARLNHPAIATVHDFGEEGGTLYMVMEYVAGIPFRDVMSEHHIPPAVAARAIAEACRGLHAAHELRDLHGNLLGVVHRDISPDNLMLGFDGHVKVIDFGIALVKNRQAPVTEFGTVKGKPPYMSPEQVKNEAMDRRSDVFSLAVVLWELLAGHGLFDGDSIYAIARAVEHQEIKPPSQIAGVPLPFGLDAVVMNALDRDLARRTPSAAAFAEQLEGVIQSAGDETLEAWADRELAVARNAHRAWLAEIVVGKDAPRPVGRATGVATALPAAALGKAATQIAPISPPIVPEPPEPAASTHLPAMTGDELDRVPRRSLALPLLLGLLVLALVGGGIYWMRGSTETRKDAGVVVARADAGTDAPPDAAIDAPIDAEVDAAIDARIDAGHHHGPVHTVAHDAPTEPEPTPVAHGTATLTIKGLPDGTFLNIFIDGAYCCDTFQPHREVPAGKHTIELLMPNTKASVYKTTVTLEGGDHRTIAPAP